MPVMTTVSIAQAIRERDKAALTSALGALSGFEIAELMANRIEEDQAFIFQALPPALAAETFEYLSLRSQKKVLHALSTKALADILEAMAPDDRTALLQELPDAIVDEYLKLLPGQERSLAITLLGYPKDSVGRLMTPDYLAVKMNWTVERVLQHIRAYGHDSETINVIYVVDDHDRLIDDINIKDLLFVPPAYTVSQITDRKFVALSVNDKAEKAILLFKEYDRVALPVVDEQGTLRGIVTVDDILRLASEKNTANVQRIGGTEALDEPYMQTPFLHLMKKRARWLILLFLGEMFTATAMGFFEGEIAKAVVLALFLPLIISSGGNAGSQSSTLIIRALALGELKIGDWFRILRREISSGLFLGCVLGVIGFARVTIWSSVSSIYGAHWLLIAITILLALIGVVFWGSTAGAMLPLILKRYGVDPAVASAPLVATLVDVTGIVIYFLIALVVLRGTLL